MAAEMQSTGRRAGESEHDDDDEDEGRYSDGLAAVGGAVGAVGAVVWCGRWWACAEGMAGFNQCGWADLLD